MDTDHSIRNGEGGPIAVKRILIVDDNPIILKSLSMMLAPRGYQTLLATDGGQAVSMVRRDRPDLILLDITFPPDVSHGGGVPWDGFLILDWLRRMPEAKDVPVIIISGGDAAELSARSRAAGALAFLHKPIHSPELLKAVQYGLGRTLPQAAPLG
jgi:CheY-like chemotaxis protein